MKVIKICSGQFRLDNFLRILGRGACKSDENCGTKHIFKLIKIQNTISEKNLSEVLLYKVSLPGTFDTLYTV